MISEPKRGDTIIRPILARGRRAQQRITVVGTRGSFDHRWARWTGYVRVRFEPPSTSVSEAEETWSSGSWRFHQRIFLTLKSLRRRGRR